MQGKNLPIVIIVVGVLLAAGAAVYMKRETPPEPNPPKGNSPVTSANPGAPVDWNNLGGGHKHGKPEAKVNLVEFGDFQCPSCGHYHPMVSALLEDSPDLVKLEFHHYPLFSIHPNAMAAAIAAEAAGGQGKYWEMHNILFERQKIWSTQGPAEVIKTFTGFARELGLDAAKFQQAFAKESPEQAIVIKDAQLGNDVNVQGTPTFYVNGQRLDPLPDSIQAFKQAILERLPASAAK